MNALHGLNRKINTILLVCVLLLVMAISLAWDRFSRRGAAGNDRVLYASELLAHGLSHEAAEILQAEVDASPFSPESLRLRRTLAEILMDKIGDHEKALAELVFLRTYDSSQKAATEELVSRCMDRLGRVYDVQRRRLLQEGKNPLESQISSATAIRVGNEDAMSVAELSQRLAQVGLPLKDPPREQFDRIIQSLAGEILLKRAAKRAGIDRQPRFLDQVRQFENNLALQQYLEEHVLKDVTVDEQALSLYLEKNKAQFDSPLRVVYSALHFPDEASARALVNGQKPASEPLILADRINATPEDLPKPLKSIQWETDPPRGPLGPVEIDGKWMVYPIHEVVPAKRVPPELARQQSRLKLLEEKQGGKISLMLADLARKEELKILDENIQQKFFTATATTTKDPRKK